MAVTSGRRPVSVLPGEREAAARRFRRELIRSSRASGGDEERQNRSSPAGVTATAGKPDRVGKGKQGPRLNGGQCMRTQTWKLLHLAQLPPCTGEKKQPLRQRSTGQTRRRRTPQRTEAVLGALHAPVRAPRPARVSTAAHATRCHRLLKERNSVQGYTGKTPAPSPKPDTRLPKSLCP